MNKKRLFFSLGMVILGLGLYVHGSTSNPSTMQSHLLWIKLWGIPLGLLLLMFFPKRKTRLEPIEAKNRWLQIHG